MLTSQIMILTEKTGRLVGENLSFFVEDNNELFLKKFSELMIFIRVIKDKKLKERTYKFRYIPRVTNIFTVNSISTNEELEFIMMCDPVLKLLPTVEMERIIKRYDQDYLNPLESLQLMWMKKINRFKVKDEHIKIFLQNSSVCIQKTLINYDYFDLYKVTHGILFASDFGNDDVGKYLEISQLLIVKSNLFMDLIFALKSRHGDLAGELFICLICLKKYLSSKDVQLLIRLLEMYVVNEAIPFLDSIDELKNGPNTYHYVLVLGMLGKTYERYFGIKKNLE